MGTPTILIAEDEHLVRSLAAEVLRDSGYHVFEAQDAGSAIAVILRFPNIDMLFTDVAMPGALNGVELARVATAMLPAVRILITSGDLAYSKDGEAEKFDFEFIQKPYSPGLLIDRVSAMLSTACT